MDAEALLKMSRDADTLTWFVLFRRLFTEIGRMREVGWIAEQAKLADQEVRALKPEASGIAFNPETIDLAAGTIAKMLSGITIHGAPGRPQ